MQNNIQQQFKTWLNTSSVWPKTAASVDPAASFQQFQSSVAESRDPECDLPHPTLRTRTHMHALLYVLSKLSRTNLCQPNQK